MGSLALDLRVAWRRLAQRPASTAVAVATLALGIGGCLAMFALTDALLLRPLRFPHPERLVTLWDRSVAGQPENVGYQTLEDWQRRSTSLEAAAAMSLWLPTALGGGDAEQIEGLRVSDGFFRVLGAEAAVGRLFRPEEDVRGNHRVVVLSHGFWQRRFGGAASAIGATLHFDGGDYRVVGVLPASFEPVFGTKSRPLAEIFAPLAYNDSLSWSCRDCRHLRVVGRLRPGVTLAAARAEIDRLSVAIAAEHPGAYSAPGALVVPLQEALFGDQRPLLVGILGAVGLVLLMATANLAGIRFATTVPRREELAMRRALGAGRRELVRLLLVESALVAALGAAAGVGLARLVLRVAVAAAPPGLDRLRQAAIDPRALGVALLLAALATLVFGMLPAWSVTRMAGARVAGGRERRRALATLVAADVALGVVLLAGAGLFGRSLQRVLAQPPGFRTERLLTMDLGVAGPRAESVERTAQLYRDLLARLRALPQVESAAVATQLPLSGSVDRFGIHAEGFGNPNPQLDPAADRYGVSPEYFATVALPLRAGRLLDAGDTRPSEKVALVSEALARRIWGEQSPLGRRVRVGGIDGPWRTVVGVVGDVRHDGLEATSPGALYMPVEQEVYEGYAEASVSLVARTSGDPYAIAGAARDLLRQLDPDVAVSRVSTMDAWIDVATQPRRFAAELLAAFAGVALLLAALGVHGIVALAVAARRRELGVRRALGASDRGVVWLLLRQVLAMAGVGAAFGLLAALATGRAVRAQLYDVAPSDPGVLLAVIAILLLVALGAAFGPARRALRVEPAVVMREE